MRAVLLTALTMVAFASNSLLNRAAIEGGHADPVSFAVIRVVSGAFALTAILLLRGQRLSPVARSRWGGATALTIYMIGFSLAYLSLDAGLGALILFGTVQIALFAHSALTSDAPTRRQIAGASVAFCGLALALWPSGEIEGSLGAALAMVLAGLGWAAYTLAGRGAADPVAVTATHFVLCVPMIAGTLLIADISLSAMGWILAIICGALTSGLGYALWYAVLPLVPGARAAIVQLSVPVIAIALGAVLLGEALTLRVVGAAGLVLGGIALALRK